MNEWWKSYFQSGWNIVGSYGHSPEATKVEAAFLDFLLRKCQARKLLDVPCGFARVAVELAQHGYDITALDLDETALQMGQNAASEANVSLNWAQGDMRKLPYEAEFDAVLCLFGSFGYFDDAGNLSFLQSAASALKPGGNFFLDTHVTETLLPYFTPKEFWKIDDCIIFEERDYNPITSRLEGEWEIIKNTGERTRKKSSIRIYTFAELQKLLQTCGFKTLNAFADHEGTAFAFGADRLLLWLEKRV